jgi:hypothetical protein
MKASPFSFRFTGASETEKCRTVDGLISFGYLRFLLIDSEEDSMTDKFFFPVARPVFEPCE